MFQAGTCPVCRQNVVVGEGDAAAAAAASISALHQGNDDAVDD